MGFSRGAFTARSVAVSVHLSALKSEYSFFQELITEIGLLNTQGMEYLYPIFKDIENIRNHDYKDKFPTVPFPNKPIPAKNGKEYRRRLEEVR